MNDDQVENVRQRVHKLADTVQQHETRIVQHAVLIDNLNASVAALRSQMSTRDQLDSAVVLFGVRLDNAVAQMGLKLQDVQNGLDPIRRGIYWSVSLILGAVILAIVALVLKR